MPGLPGGERAPPRPAERPCARRGWEVKTPSRRDDEAAIAHQLDHQHGNQALVGGGAGDDVGGAAEVDEDGFLRADIGWWKPRPLPLGNARAIARLLWRGAGHVAIAIDAASTRASCTPVDCARIDDVIEGRVVEVTAEEAMVKAVGPDGLMSLGVKFAGKRFQLVEHDGERIELIPVTDLVHADAAPPGAPDGWLPPGGYQRCNRWARDNRAAIEAYARRVEEEGTAAEQLERYLAAHPDALHGDDGAL